MTGVSFVVPVHNGAAFLAETLDAILAQSADCALEVIVVDDRSVDGSAALAERLAEGRPIRVLHGAGRGAAAAINLGVAACRHSIVCQVDQDVRLHPDWLNALLEELNDPDVAAAQGVFAADRDASLLSRVMGLDLQLRYAGIVGDTDHVCTGNTAYRVSALQQIGLFDEALGYGYDNDVSYRLREAGFRLAICPNARSTHRWREGIAGYAVQQYGFGYGRIDLVAKHPRRAGGDRVSPAAMMMHPLIMMGAVAALAVAAIVAALGWTVAAVAGTGLFLIGVLFAERALAAARAVRRFGDPAAWLFPFVHLGRDLVWVCAIVAWVTRHFRGVASMPADSMRSRRADGGWHETAPVEATSRRVIGLIPAHNEASNLRSVIADVARWRPDLEILVVDDGSTDETADVVRELGVTSIQFSERMGIGSAMRAGLRYAVRLGFDAAVRLDGDGQHRASEIDAVLAPIVTGDADVVLGTRFATRCDERGALRLLRAPLAGCLTALTGRPVTDPTSGFCAFGAKSMRFLAVHHPDGYAEPELRLLLSRNDLRVVEVPVSAQSRLSGRTSLTPGRVVLAGARVLLAMLIVPLRPVIKEPR